MRWFKKIVRAILALLPLFAFVFISSDTHALMHDYDTLFIVSDQYYSQNVGHDLSSFYGSDFPLSDSLGSVIPSGAMYGSDFRWSVLQNGACSDYTGTFYNHNILISSSSTSRVYSNRWTRFVDFGSSSYSGDLLCNPVPGNWYAYDSLYLTGVNQNGLRRYAKISDIFDLSSSYIYRFALPLAYNENTVGVLTPNRPIEFTFTLSSSDSFYSSDSSGNLSPFDINKLGFTLSLYAYNEDTDSYFKSIISSDPNSSENSSYFSDCSVISQDIQPDSVLYHQLQFRCTFTSPANLSHVHPNISVFHYDSSLSSSQNSVTPSWYNPGDVYFGLVYVVTDNDRTPGASASIPPSGFDLTQAPGYAETVGDDTGGNLDEWFNSLTNLFGFSFINPFGALFSLFTDQSACVSIPTIAGMLNASDSTYCPWFSATTRNILTPVLGIASLMLVFGFIVRWLGSSSGNMFEDQTSHKWSNTQFKQRGEK